jgi:hypothetical protein
MVFKYVLFTTTAISSIELGKKLNVTQKTAWFMLQRLRESMGDNNSNMFDGLVEIDKTYIDAKEKNKHSFKKIKGSKGGLIKKWYLVLFKEEMLKKG